MIPRRSNDSEPPHPELLAAYADGELDAAGRTTVEAWLAEHPEAATEVEAHWHLAQCCQVSVPPEPAAATWSVLLGRIEAALPNAAGPAPDPSAGWSIRSLARFAAALLLALTLAGGGLALVMVWILNRPPVTNERVEVEPSAPVSDEPPGLIDAPGLWSPIVLVSRSDVTDIEHEQDDTLRWVGMNNGTTTPMLIATDPDKED